MKKRSRAPRRDLEKILYPLVERWLKRHFLCFRTALNKGLRHSRIDVIGVRDVGGELSGKVETIAVEVKRGLFPFANASGQTLGYNVYANRVYLADVREKSFTQDELHIASHLGIGLIQIRRGRCIEALSSPFYEPIERMNLRLLETLRLGQCRLCGSFFETGKEGSKYSNLARENVSRAMNHDKGLMFWNREVAARKHRLRIRLSKNGTTHERRFVCPDCVQALLAQLSPAES